jgi:glutaredoxin
LILVIGTPNCSRCNMTKTILGNKGIDFSYKLNNELPKEEFDKYLEKAKVAGLMNFPLIIRDKEVIRLEDIVK